MNKVLYDELLKAINEADEDSMVTDKEAEPDYTDQDDIENEEVPDIEDANDELKESIYEFLNDLKASGIPVTEDDISNVIYDHITNIVESAKMVGVMESTTSRMSKALVRAVTSGSSKKIDANAERFGKVIARGEKIKGKSSQYRRLKRAKKIMTRHASK